MRIIGCLIFYDESPTWLAGCVSSLRGFVDHLVAVDGAYFLFPGAAKQPASPPGQADVIVEVARACGIALTLYVPTDPFMGNEVEKRQLSLDLCAMVSTDEDWIFICDADVLVVKHSLFAKKRLAETDLVAAEVGMITHTDTQADSRLAEQLRNQNVPFDSQQTLRCLFKAQRGLRYENAHYVIRTDDGYVWGNPTVHQPMADAEDLTRDLVIEHRNRLRDRPRANRAREFYRVRDELGIEALRRVYMEGPDGNPVLVTRR